MKDIINQPSHYTDNVIEPIELIMRNDLPFALGNVVKYVSRAGKKKYEGMTEQESEITDLKKAMRYLEMQINLIEGKEKL